MSDNEYLAKRDYVDTQLAAKQDKLIAGTNITIGPDGKTISATGGGATYTAGTGISISPQNEIGLSAQTQATLAYLDQNKQDKLVAGDGISIEGNVISATGGGGGGGGGGGAAEPEVLWENQTTPFKSGTLTVPHLSEWLQVGYCVYPNSDIMSVGTPAMGEGGLGAYNMDAIWNIAHRFNYNPIAETITIDQLNQGIYHSTDVTGSTYNGGDGIYKIIGLIKKPSTEPTGDVLKTYHTTGTTESNGYLAIDLNNNTIDPSTVFAIVADENCTATCMGLTWKNSVLTGVFTLRGNYSGGTQNMNVSYTVFYYDKTIPNSGISSYVASTLTHPSEGTFAIDLNNDNINPDSIFAVVLDSTYSSNYDAICLAPSWGLVNDVSTLRSCAVNAVNFNSRRTNVLIPYRVFYTTNESTGIKRVGVQCSASGQPTSIVLPDEYDKRTFFNLILNKNEPTSTPSIKDLFNKGLYFDSGNLKTYIGALTNPTAPGSATSFNANAFYIDSSEPEPSTDTCIKTYTASGITDTHGYFPIDLQNGTVDPENIFSVVAAENNEGNVCTGLVWDSNGILNGVYMSKSVSGIAQANKTLSYTVFYYDDSVDNNCVNTYTATNTTSIYGNMAIDLQNGDIDPFSIFAVTVDSSSSTSDVLCSGVDWWTDGNPKTIDAAFMFGKNLGSLYGSGQITYKVFYYTRANDCVKTIETDITTTSTGEGELPIGSVDPNKVFSVIMTDDLPAGSSGDETMSRGLVLSSNSISALFANGWEPTSAKSNITFPAIIFYLNDGGVVPPEPSKQEVITHTTAEWAQLTSLVSEKDVIYIWSDYKVKDGTPIPAMKVGDGDAYVLDLPFATQAITEDDIAKWNTVTSKVSARVEGNVLILE